jgi:hypothetical protein
MLKRRSGNKVFFQVHENAHSYIHFSSVARLEVRGLWAELRKQHTTKNESITNIELFALIVWFGSALAMQRSILFQRATRSVGDVW